MDEIASAVLAAQQDRDKLNQLIVQYLPFIRNQLTGLHGFPLEYDDMLSLAMLTFSGCVQQYTAEKGSFLAFCTVCIRNRLLDAARKQARYQSKLLPLVDDESARSARTAEDTLSLAAYNAAQEQAALAQEIEAFSQALKQFGVDFASLPRCCPRQKRSRLLCMRLARAIVDTPAFLQLFWATRRIAQKELSVQCTVSPKTIEKHRKYIVTLVLLITGDYPYIQAFLPGAREVL